MKTFIILALALLAISATFAAPPAIAHNHPGYHNFFGFGAETVGNNPDWMAAIPGERKISELSIPGTHDTMARFGGDFVEAQSMTLAQQLESGIRVLDIRVAYQQGKFLIYHGFKFQEAEFGADVLEVAKKFLRDHPKETIFMKVASECEETFFSCDDDDFPEGENFTSIYRELYEPLIDEIVWKNPTQKNNPTLEEVRGKIVMLVDTLGVQGLPYWWSSQESPGGEAKGNPFLQNAYNFGTNWDLYDKWLDVRSHLIWAASKTESELVNLAAEQDRTTSPIVINYLSGSASKGIVLPYFVASGHSDGAGSGSPRLSTGCTTAWCPGFYSDFPRTTCILDLCTISYEGTNILTTDLINHGNRLYRKNPRFKGAIPRLRGRVGIILADFPGIGLIDAVIGLNNSLVVTNTNDSGEGSLRWAIANSGSGEVSFAPELSGETILLDSEIVINAKTTIDASTLSDGITISGGGVSRVFNVSQPVVVKLSGMTIADGLADQGADIHLAGKGAGIYSLGKSLTIDGCTFTNNVATDLGSAIYQNKLEGEPDGVLTITNSTIAENISSGGSISNAAGEMILEHCTVANNRNDTDSAGAGILNFGLLKLSNTIVALNTAERADGTLFLNDISGDLNSLAPNIVGMHEHGTITGTPLISFTDPQLGPLADNGGPTWTMLPGVNSPALGAATRLSRESLKKDQRGDDRPARPGTNPVIGAVEVPVGPTIQVFLQGGALLEPDGEPQGFGNVLPGMFGFVDFGIGNAGNATLSGLSITIDGPIDGPDAGLFTLLRSPASQINPQGTTSFYVQFAPTSPGKKQANLRIASNDPDHNPYPITLSGIGESTFSTTGTTGGKPTWNRPDEGRPPSVLSASATATPYDVVSFTVRDPGDYTVTSSVTNPGQWDNYLFLYNLRPEFGAFDASAPLSNGLIGDRGGLVDGADRGVASFTFDLAPGIRYYLVTTGNTNNDYGDYTVKLAGPSDFEVFVPPAISGPILSQTDVSAYPTFSWASTPGATYEVFLGTDPGSLLSLGFHASPFTISPPLSYNTTYYWRLDSHQSGAVVSGGVQSFTTRSSIEVTTALDENDGSLGLGSGDSLREAIAAAAAGAASTIEFAAGLSGQTIRLGESPLAITTDLAIDGSSLPAGIKISGNNGSRVFEIASGIAVAMDALTITQGTVPDGENGAGILNLGNLALTDTTISENSAHTGKGGGIHNLGILVLDSSTLSENDASHGGGIYNEGTSASATLTNATLSGNTGAEGGGGITHASDAGLTLTHVTMTENFSSLGKGAGMEISSGSVTIGNSIIAGNDALNGNSSIDKTGGTITPAGANIIGDNSSVSTEFPGSDPLVGTAPNNLLNPELSPLDFFDGRTKTRPPLPGSSAFDAAIGPSPDFDQRGISRPKGPAADIGAVESELSGNSDLAKLATSAGRLSPVFWRDVTEYSVSVGTTVASARVKMSPDNDQATLKVGINGGALSALGTDETSSPLPLNPGDNLIEVEVTAENGTTKTYTIAVTRGAPPETNTDLNSLNFSGGSLSPPFALGVTSYSAIVGNGTTDITVTPATGVADATIEAAVNFGPFNPVTSGEASSPLALEVGSNLIEIRVTARDGATVATHKLTVIREAPAVSNGNLSALLTDAGELRPGFSREVFFYNVRVNEEITSATVTPTAVQPSLASIEVQTNEGGFSPIASNATSSPLALNPGANFIEVKVTSQDGTSVNSYTIMVTRSTHDLEWVSIDTIGPVPGDNHSINPSISAGGRYVAFSSSATNLVAGDTNNSEDIFVYDRDANTIERVSIDNNGVQGDFDSTDPSISADGRYVAFHSEATNLVPGDTNGDVDISFGADIFVYDRDSGTIERVSLTDSGGQSNQASETPTISGDGRYVAFASHANNLVSGFETHSNVNIYIHDRDADSIVGIDVPFGDFRANRDLLNPAVSADGSFVAFELSVNRSEFPQYQYTDIYLYHQSNRTVERITGDYEGLPSDGNHSKAPSISDDGRYVAFHSTIDGIDFDDTNGAIDVFVYDRIEGHTERLSASATGADEPSKNSGNPSISGDGRYVVFQSRASNLVEPVTNGVTHIFRKDRLTGDIAIMSLNTAGDLGSEDSGCNLDVGQISCPPSVSFDGRFVAFESMATNLDAVDTNEKSDVFVAINDASGASPVADLGSLASNLGPLSADVTSYSAGVLNEVEAVMLRPLAADPDAIIEVQINSGGFNPVDSEQISSLPLDVGLNSVDIKVTAEDASTTEFYTLEVTRAPSNDAKLSDLTLSAGSLTPSFLSSITTYIAVVSYETTSITVTPRLAQANASMTVNGEAVTSGTASSEISLNRGVNTITVVGTAQDNTTTNTYVVTVFREFSSNADLVSLVASAGALTPAFDSGTTGYVIEVPNDTTSITVTPTTAQADAAMTVNGETVSSGTASSAIDLYAGTNTISTLVTAEDGGTTKTYAITVTREGATNADLASLVLSAGTLMPAFTSNTTSYTVSAPNAMTSITVTPTVVDSSATVNVNGVTVASGTASSAISLGVGAKTITILVTAGDGTTVKSYVVEVTRAPNTPLADVVIDFGPQAGIWLRYSNSMWLKLHPTSPESMVAGDIDGNGEDDLIVNFGPGVGIWVRYDNMTWAKLHPTSPDSMVTGDIDGNGQDDVMIDFGPGTGIWVRYNNATWTKLHPTSPDSMVTGDIDGNGQDDVMIDFGPQAGIWVRYNDAVWTKLHPTSPDSMVTGDIDGNGQDDVMIDFGPQAGIWVRYNNAAWAKLHPTSPDSMVTGDIDGNGQDDVMIDFGPGTGIWVRYNNAAWTKLHPTSPDSMVTGDIDGNGKDEVIIEFGLGTGIWIRYNDTAWSKLHSSSSESMVVSEYNK